MKYVNLRKWVEIIVTNPFITKHKVKKHHNNNAVFLEGNKLFNVSLQFILHI